MREFGNKITLVKNFRGIYDLDTSKGCLSGMLENEKGCYNDCYAARYSKKYGYDFSKTNKRYFTNDTHRNRIIKQINNIDMPFVRIGVTGDPSENWEHTLNVCNDISECNKTIVTITKHWRNLTESQLIEFSKLNIVFNTSISALDKPKLIRNRLKQYNRIKPYCKSILRIISCDFNLRKKEGVRLSKLQKHLFKNENTLDNVLRVYKKNQYVVSGLINIEELKFMGKKCYFSIMNKDAYIDKCYECPDMCGLNT